MMFRLSQLALNALDRLLGLGHIEEWRLPDVSAHVAGAIFRVNKSGVCQEVLI
jgi:hypothetical protein